MALVEHRRVRFDYEILETFEAGLVLLGHEVKSLRAKQGKLEGAHVIVRGGEAFLVGASIPPYQAKNHKKDYDPERPRKLMIDAKTLAQLSQKSEKERLTIVPISVYNKGRYLKLGIAVAKGKKKTDKRETIKKRESDRDIERLMKRL